MRLQQIKDLIIIGLSLFLSFILAMLPLPGWADWFRPQWVLLFLIYWSLALPHRVSVGIAFILGLLVDILNGSLLGLHALAMILISYFVIKFHRRLRLFPLWQQTCSVGLLLFFYQFIIFFIRGLTGQTTLPWFYWLSSVTSTIFWPWLYVLLRDYRRRFTTAPARV